MPDEEGDEDTVRSQDESPSTYPLTDEEATDIAIEAYLYASPIVQMEVHRRVLTNQEASDGKQMRGPMNQFTHLRNFPDASVREVVGPNFDTLYSWLWYDVSDEPLVISLPESTGHYFLIPIVDAWTDVFASPGTRTTGPGAFTFALVGPDWRGALPEGVEKIHSPTSFGWLPGRTRASRTTIAEANAFQDQLQAVPLSRWGQPYTPPAGTVDPDIVMEVPPSQQVRAMDAPTFWSLFGELWQANPPHSFDYPLLHRMARLGLETSQPIDFDALPSQSRRVLTRAVQLGQQRIDDYWANPGRIRNGWWFDLQPLGNWGMAYLMRATIAWWAIGANIPEDALYPLGMIDNTGQPLDGANNYVLHFAEGELPPVDGFWSLSMYDSQMFQVANPIDRFAIGDRDELAVNEDGSLSLYIQHESPGKDKESNWLPSPPSGGIIPIMRLYGPQQDAIVGRWDPPEWRRV
jgi:hypothetical protein